MMEEQVTGARFSSKVSSWTFDSVTDGTTAKIVLGQGLNPIVLPLPIESAVKIQRGDNVTVTVEVTREP